MKKPKLPLAIVGVTLCLFGLLLGLTLAAVATWADVEAAFYGFEQFGKKNSTLMRCPVFLTKGEVGSITATFKNPAAQAVRPTVKFQVSNPWLIRTEMRVLSLAPGESYTLQWEVGGEDIVWRRFIFAKMYTFASYPLPDLEQTCGILVLGVSGLRGVQVYYLTLGLAAVLFLGGLWLVKSSALFPAFRQRLHLLLFLLAMVIADLLSVALSWWVLGVILTAFSLLTLGILIGRWLQR